jgi:hypothetical protein
MATGFIETAGSLTNTTVSVAANAGRRGLIVGNPSDTVMTVRFGATASATAGIPVAAGSALEFRNQRACPDGLVSVFCAGTAKNYTIYEW